MNELTPNVPNESQAAPAVQDAPAGPVKNRGGRPPRNKIADTLEETLKQMDDLLKSDNPNPTKQRVLDRKLEYYLAQQKRNDERRNSQVVADNQRLKAEVEMLQEKVSQLQPRAEGYDTAVQQAQEARREKQQLDSGYKKAQADLATAESLVRGFKTFAAFIGSSFDDDDKKKLFALKIFLAHGTAVPDECYLRFALTPEDLSLWQQLQRTWGNIKPDQLVQFYADLPPSAADKRWFLKHRLQIEFTINVDEKLREQQQQEREKQERQERLRENQRIEAGARAQARLMDNERDPALKLRFDPNIEYIP